MIFDLGRLHATKGSVACTIVHEPSGLGVTIWYRGAISLLAFGHVPLQLVFGDWWKASVVRDSSD
jgi:hypothetical protein